MKPIIEVSFETMDCAKEWASIAVAQGFFVYIGTHPTKGGKVIVWRNKEGWATLLPE